MRFFHFILINKKFHIFILFFGNFELFNFCFLWGEDVSTDGKWCYLVFWVIGKSETRWSLLKSRLMEACPSCSSASGISFYLSDLQPPKPPDVFLLTLCCRDRKGLLHGKLFELIFLSKSLSTSAKVYVFTNFYLIHKYILLEHVQSLVLEIISIPCMLTVLLCDLLLYFRLQSA